MPTQNPEKLIEAVRSQLGNIRSHWSTCYQRRFRHRRIAVFGHIARLQDSTTAHKALQSHVNLSLGRLPHPSWSRRPGRPRGRWTKSEATPARHLPTSGDRPLDAVIMDERRDGPRWLCDDDGDVLEIS